MPESEIRRRIVTWEDPAPSLSSGREMSGLDYLKAIASGQLPRPPITQTLDFEFDSIEDGTAVFVCTPAEHHYNPIGVVHGGLAATLIDSATGCAVHSTLPAGQAYTTTNLSVDYLRPATSATGLIRCEGRVVHRGSRLAIAEGTVTVAATGKVIARGQGRCMIYTP